MALPPIPLRVPMCESFSGPPVVAIVLKQSFVSHEYAVFWNAIIQAVNLSTPAGTFANNAAAVAAGLPLRQVYQTAAGDLKVVI